MKKINFKLENKFIYIGNFDNTNEEIGISIDTEIEKLKFNLRKIIKIGNPDIDFLTVKELRTILNDLELEASIFPNGKAHLIKMNSNDELKTCYLSIVTMNSVHYVICIAFDETQPTLYKAQFVSAYLIENRK